MSNTLLTEPVAIFLTIISVILITPLISERFKLPGIVGLIIGGMFIGPNGLHLLAVNESIELLSTVGLIYLMFSAGLEVNLQQFNRVRNKSLIFGILTYALPQTMGLVFGRLLGMDWPGSILLGSAFSSHTLIAFPVLTRLGIIKNDPISITIGATIFTDITAFIVLAAIIAISGGTLEPVYFIKLVIMLAAFTFLVLYGIPVVGKWFLKRFHHLTVEFQFILVALFFAAILAELIGIHAVVGAFLAGLAINATLPHRSPVINHILFLGESFFIPVFLVYSGMITDAIAFLQNWNTILIGLGMTFIAYVSKFIAAWISGKFFHSSKDEIITVWGLSQAQAAVTIPTLIIGVELGLFSNTLFNAAIMMVLLTSITSPLIVQRFGKRLHVKSTPRKYHSALERVLVAIANPDTKDALLEFGAALADNSEGIILPLNVAVDMRGQIEGVESQQKLFQGEVFENLSVKKQPIRRIDASAAKGIIRASLEQSATLIVLGWGAEPRIRQRVFSTLIDEVVWNASIPVIISKLTVPINAYKRIVLLMPTHCQPSSNIDKTIEIVNQLSQAINISIEVFAAAEYIPVVSEKLIASNLDHPYKVHGLEEGLNHGVQGIMKENDLVLVPTTGSKTRFRSSLGYFTENLLSFSKGSIAVIHFPTVK